MSVAMTYGNMGLVYYNLGNFEKALEMHERDLEIKLKTVGPLHASVADTKLNIGIVYSNKGDQAAAKASYKEAYDIYLRCFGPDHPKITGLAPFI